MKKQNILLILALSLFFCETSFAQWGSVNRAIRQGIREGARNSTIGADEVSIEKIPSTVAEFQALQAELGTTPEGCIMLQLVAIEMYRRDKNIGTECLTLNNTSTNLSSVTSRLKEIFRENDTYARPHLVSTYFKGAKPSNGCNPAYPNDERSQALKGYVKYYQVYSEGYDTPWRGIEVVQQKGDPYYRVSNCPAVYIQCKEVDFDATEDWKGLD